MNTETLNQKQPTSLQINRRQSITSPTTPPTKKKSKPHHRIKSINVKKYEIMLKQNSHLTKLS
jgi:hypothetical protein